MKEAMGETNVGSVDRSQGLPLFQQVINLLERHQ